MPRIATAQRLPDPIREFVEEEIAKFDSENGVIEAALTDLVATYRRNVDLGHILLKVSAINTLYSTQIRGVFAVAEEIRKKEIDARLDTGDLNVVDQISSVDFGGKQRCNYSFATKYCSWHRPEFYPIYDSRVDYVLRVYAKQNAFSKFTQETLWNYSEFHRVVSDFRHSFGLEHYSFKETDKFLYQLGSDLLGEMPPEQKDVLA
jgi:hypothetical protein